eukprot:Skav204245  [mRNA]  locus=scaffold2414:1846:11079:- [translate_table: standard]
MSWYSKPSSRWWQEDKEWREKGSAKVWNSDHKGKDDWEGKEAKGEWTQSTKGEKSGDWNRSPGEWSEWSKGWKAQQDWESKDSKDKDKDSKDKEEGQQGQWKASQEWSKAKNDWKAVGEKTEGRAQRHQWVAKSEKPKGEKADGPEKPPPQVDPSVALEDALADVEELLGERLDSTRILLEESHKSSREAVSLVTRALELLTKKTSDCKGEQDVNKVIGAKKSIRELLMWRNFGLKMWLHNKPDPMNFQTYDANVQNELRQTWTKIEQKLMQELIAGDSWSKLARKLRFCVGNKEFSVEMRTLLTRIINTCELTNQAKHKRADMMEMPSEAEHSLFEEMAADDTFGEEVIRAVRNDRLRQPEAIYPPYAQAAGPAWMQQMLGWHVQHPSAVQNGLPAMARGAFAASWEDGYPQQGFQQQQGYPPQGPGGYPPQQGPLPRAASAASAALSMFFR